MKRVTNFVLLLCIALILCASIPLHAAEAARSGFLTDYSKLEPNAKYPGSSDWIDPAADLGKYKAIVIDSVTIRLSSGLIKGGARPDPEFLNEVLDYLHQALVREFSKRMTVVKQPAENAIHYRAAITGITTEGGVGSSAMNVLPAAFLVRTVSGRNAIRAHLFMEAAYSDTLTGAPVGAVMQSAAGGAVSSDSKGDAQISLRVLKGVLDQWAEKAADVASEKLGNS